MKFIDNLSKEEYENFVKKHKGKSHFLQSYAWGEFSRECKNMYPYYVGIRNDHGQIIAAALLLQKKLFLGYSYFYSPRGFIIDFFDYDILNKFTLEVKNFIKNKKGIFLKIDPDIIWNKKDYNNEEKILDNDPKIVFDYLSKLKYKHLGFTKGFETMQPRYSFRIDMNQSFSEIENKFSKTTKQRIKKAESLGVEVKMGDEKDIDVFFNLMRITENRKDFVAHDLKYYKRLYEIYNKENIMNLFLGIVDVDKIIIKLKRELTDVQNELNEFVNDDNLSKSKNNKKNELLKRVETLTENISYYSKQKDIYGNNVVTNGHMIIEYDDKAWVLYAGNHNILTSTYANYKTYYEHIKYCYNKGIKMYDQFGTIGNPSMDDARYGLHEFKKKFGGDYVEFIGEFDLVVNKLMYFMFVKLVPIYRKTIRFFAKKKIKENK